MPHSKDHNSNYFHVGQRLTLTLLKKLNLFYSFSVAEEQKSLLLSFRFCPRDTITGDQTLMKDGYFFFMTRNSRLARPGNNERPQTITSDRFLYDLQ